jgi:hypothetical protein
MAEQTFRSPGFFEQEIDLSAQVQSPVGVPAGVIGTAQKGPAFVPVTVGSLADFQTKFGSLDPNRFGPYAVNEWLKNRTALTYLRVLGAGANSTAADISNTKIQGIVKNAGFKVSGTVMATNQRPAGAGLADVGTAQFLVAQHEIATSTEANGYPLFTDNSSVTATSTINLVRGVILTATGSRVMLAPNNEFYSNIGTAASINAGHLATAGAIASSPLTQSKYFKIILSSTLAAYGTAESKTGLRILSASLDPSDGAYIGKILNTDPLRFGEEQHLLYADFSVEHDLAKVVTTAGAVAIVSGSVAGSANSGAGTSLTFKEMFGRYDTRYTTAATTSFISQPYGRKEYDLFHFESLDDGETGNNNFKVSIANLRASTNPADPYGTFEVQVRALGDLDTAPQIVESFAQCSLNPQSERYVARMVGDKKVYYDFDQEDPTERRLVISGKYPNVSQRVRIVMNASVENNNVPADAMPFGFRGVPTLKTTDTLKDKNVGLVAKDGRTLGDSTARRLDAVSGTIATAGSFNHLSSIVPPLPFRVKVTRGATATSGFLGNPGTNERVDARFYWGVNTARIPVSSSTDPALGTTDAVLRPNEGSDFNSLITAYGKFVGIKLLDSLVTGSGADEFNDNKFTLARVATSQTGTGLAGVFGSAVFTGSADQVMLETAYIRNGNPDTSDYTIDDGIDNRYTLASLLATSSVLFNRFTPFAKFTNIFYGGFDGIDITDRDRIYFRDKALSSDTGGKADSAYRGPLDVSTQSDTNAGSGRKNNNVASMNAAAGIMTDTFSSNINLLAIPGVREPFVTDNAMSLCRDNGLIMYVMDMPKYDSSGNRLYDDSSTRPDPGKTSETFESRAIDNSYGAVFFPDVNIQDSVNNRVVKVPSSVVALGVLGFNDKVAFPWFAPAGFNRGALGFVTNVETRLSQGDKDTLYDARINPIATFPTGGFVVFGQKTLQQAKSALDRINVRRLLLELKRIIGGSAQQLLFEPNNAVTRARFVASVTPQLALVQAQSGVESFKVVCDDSNNSAEDVASNKLNGRIVIVPTRTIEFVSIDFIITNSGVQFL